MPRLVSHGSFIAQVFDIPEYARLIRPVIHSSVALTVSASEAISPSRFFKANLSPAGIRSEMVTFLPSFTVAHKTFKRGTRNKVLPLALSAFSPLLSTKPLAVADSLAQLTVIDEPECRLVIFQLATGYSEGERELGGGHGLV
jgi:hypothetical protein